MILILLSLSGNISLTFSIRRGIDILDNLMILFKNYKNELLDTPLVVISDRVSKYAKKNGFISKICIVKEKEDSGIFQCLLEIAGE